MGCGAFPILTKPVAIATIGSARRGYESDAACRNPHMIKLFPLAAFAAFAFPLTVAAQTPDTLPVNPGFEGDYVPVHPTAAFSNKAAVITGQVAPGWSDNSDWASVTVAYSRDVATVHGGKSAQHITVSRIDGGAVQFNAAPVMLKKGNVYRYSVWVKGANGTNISLNLRQQGEPYRGFGSRSFLMGGDWRKCEVTGTVNEDTAGFLMLRMTVPGEISLDDAVFENLTTKVSTAPARIGNLITNGSFEAGDSRTGAIAVGGGWNVRYDNAGDPADGVPPAFADTRPRRDTQTVAPVGKACWMVAVPKGLWAQTQSPPFEFNYGRAHTVSVWLKTSREERVSVGLYETGATQAFEVTPQWKRYTFTGVPRYRATTFLTAYVSASAAPVILWMDGVQVEETNAASPDYVPNAPVKLTVVSDKPGHVYLGTDPVRLTARLSGAVPKGATLRYEIMDVRGKTLVTRTVPIPASASGQSFVVPFAPADVRKPRGVFKTRTRVVGAKNETLSAPVECVYAVLPPPRQIAPEKSYFGIHIPLTPEFIAISLATGNRWARLHDTSMIGKWATVEATKGTYQFGDDGVTAATKSGMAILGMLDGAPAWATTMPRQGYWAHFNIPDKPGAKDDWANYVSTVAKHYAGRIDHWEIWNEPWGEWFVNSGNPAATPQLYGDLVRIVGDAAKKANPRAKIIAINAARSADVSGQWTRKALAAVSPERFDALSFHLYDDAIFGGANSTPKLDADYFNAAQKQVGKTVRPLWNTEGGPGSVGSLYAPYSDGIAPERQAAYIVRLDVLNRASDVKHFFLYALKADPFFEDTLYEVAEYDRAIRPILAGRAVLASLIDGTPCTGRTEPVKGVDEYAFNDAAMRRRVRVLWSNDSADHAVPVPGGAAVLDVYGNTLAPGKTVMVGIEPVYLIQATK